MRGETQLSSVKDEWLSKVVMITKLRVPVPVPVPLSVPMVPFVVLISFAETLLKKCGDVVGNPLEFLVAFSFGGLETSCYMPPNKRHRDGVRS